MDALPLISNQVTYSYGKEIRCPEGREGTQRIPNEILPLRHHGADEKELSPFSSGECERGLFALDVQEGFFRIFPSPHGGVVYTELALVKKVGNVGNGRSHAFCQQGGVTVHAPGA